jgi:hypothetical protein
MSVLEWMLGTLVNGFKAEILGTAKSFMRRACALG